MMEEFWGCHYLQGHRACPCTPLGRRARLPAWMGCTGSGRQVADVVVGLALAPWSLIDWFGSGTMEPNGLVLAPWSLMVWFWHHGA